jgi:hypothetical protein
MELRLCILIRHVMHQEDSAPAIFVLENVAVDQIEHGVESSDKRNYKWYEDQLASP